MSTRTTYLARPGAVIAALTLASATAHAALPPATPSLPGVPSRIAVTADVRPAADAHGFTTVVTMRPDGSDRVTVAGTSTPTDEFYVQGGPRAADVGPDGRIAFVVHDGIEPGSFADKGTELAVANADGTGKQVITDLPDFDYVLSASWSPDGSEILFEVINERTVGDDVVALLEIRAIKPDGTGMRVVAEPLNPADLDQAFGGAWSPEGEHIAYLDQGDPERLVVVRVDGTGSPIVVESTTTERLGEPVWTHDGTRLAALVQARLSGSTARMMSMPVPSIAPDDAPDTFCLVNCDGSDGSFTIGSVELSDSDPAGTLIHATLRDQRPDPAPPAKPLSVIEKSFTRTFDAATGAIRASSAHNRSFGGIGPVDAPPVVFLPGFLGSEIVCREAGDDPLWPLLPRVPALQLQLAPDGATNAPGGPDPCSNVALAGAAFALDDPGRQVTTGLVEDVAGGDIYGSAVRGLRDIMGRRVYFFPWDWRKAPQESLARLDQMVERARQTAGTDTVQLVAHSYGGLLARTYVADAARRAKVERVLTLGTPYHGAPKTFFTLAAGVETPLPSSLDLLFDNDELQQLARNLQGAFFLYPSTSYGGWLHVDGRGNGAQDAAGVRAVVGELGGTQAQLDTAQAAHAATLDSIDVPGLPWRVVAGGGLPTVSRVFLFDGQIGLRVDSGDETVPQRSANLAGSAGSAVTTVCGISHVPLAGDPRVLGMAVPYLVDGDDLTPPPDLPTAPCPDVRGTEIVAFEVDLTQGTVDGGDGGGDAAAARGSSTGEGGSLSPAAAEQAGLVDVIRLPNHQSTIIVPDGTDVTLGLTGTANARFVVRRFDGETKSAGVEYKPGTTLATLSARDGTMPNVEGVLAEPNAPPPDDKTGPDPQPTSTPTPTPAPAPATTPDPPAPTSAAPQDTAKPLADRTAPRTRARTSRRGKRIRVVLSATDPSGIKAITFRLGNGRPRRYTRPLLLTRKQACRLRFFATDRVGNRGPARRLQGV